MIILDNRQQLSKTRYDYLIMNANKCYNESDYIQCSEKIYGALTAGVNFKSSVELATTEDKKSQFKIELTKLHSIDNNLKGEMIKKGFYNDKDVFESILDLHKYFYGATDLNKNLLKYQLPFFIQILERFQN